MADRTPIFEMHIRPLFRQLDRLHMLRVRNDLDLWSYDSVKAYAAKILAYAGGEVPSMPTSDVGGPWPAEWRQLFKRWMDSGCRRLAAGIGQNYKLAQASGGYYEVSCTVSIPDTPEGDSTAWFDILDPGPTAATYQLLVFPGETAPPPVATIDIQVQERVDPAAAATGIQVIDAAGTHRVAVQL
jgi:hypothetical protein